MQSYYPKSFFFTALAISNFLSLSIAFAQQSKTQTQSQVIAIPEDNCQALKRGNKQQYQACLEQRFEVITVIGQRPLPMTIGLTGKYSLDRTFLDNSAKGNGNITDMLTILPGVQGSENALDVELQSEIRSQLISISGAQPWQTGFIFDGVANNSLIDPGANNRSVATVNYVQGHPQSTFINESLVGEVTVYDSDVPANFGQFSGGVVDVKPRSFFETPSLRLTYRTSRSDWNVYNLVDERQENEEDAINGEQAPLPTAPLFLKDTVSLVGKTSFAEKHRFVLALSKTRSKVDELSLRAFQQTQRESISSSLRYTVKDLLVDELQLHASYSPYKGDRILVDVLNSNLTNKGGGYTFAGNITQDFENFNWLSRLSMNISENSREAPSVYLPWYRAPGKAWGINSGRVPFSVEGGYGDIEKRQNRYTFKNDLNFDEFPALGGQLMIKAGASVEHIELKRNRTQTALVYNSPFRDANLDCNNQTLDCVEQTYVVPLSEFEAQFGGSINFADPIQNRAYQDNLITRGQFFQYRRVYPIENIDVTRESTALYVSNRLEYDHIRINAGLRAEYDSIFKNVNIAPRLSFGIDPFADNNYLISIGLNRYYSTGPLTYLIREQQRPYITQFRTLSSSVVGDWLTSNTAQRFSYDYSDLKTPYNDEITLGYQQSLFDGILSLKAVYRQQKQQVTRGNRQIVEGVTIISQDNLGSGEYSRYTVSYNKSLFDDSSLWMHLSFSENNSSASSYDAQVNNIPEDELVVIATNGISDRNSFQLISQNDLTFRNLDFSRPISANINIQTDWTSKLNTSINISHVGKFTSAVNTNTLVEIDRDIQVCSNCNVSNFNYPLFVDVKRPAVTLLNLQIAYDLELMQQQSLALSLEINNLFNDRTFTVGSQQTGLEVGRSFWLSLSYEL